MSYTEKEKELIAKNAKLIRKEIKEDINVINTIFGFVGINAQINEINDNQIDYYNKNTNELIYSCTYDDLCGILFLDLDRRLITSFEDENYKYSFNKTSSKVVKDIINQYILSYNDKSSDFSCTIALKKSKDKIINFELYSGNVNDEYNIKNIIVDENSINASVNNQFGPLGNYIDGEKRYLSFKIDKFGNELLMSEEVFPGDKIGINNNRVSNIFDSVAISVNDKKEYPKFCSNDFIAANLACHPRNKELIDYILDNSENQLYDIREFIKNNFSIYNLVMKRDYLPDGLSEDIMNKFIIDKCDIVKGKTHQPKKYNG